MSKLYTPIKDKKSSMVLVSIITPYFKKEKFIQECIRSILLQTYAKFELIVIYDQEDKSDLELIKNFNDKRIRIIINKKNIGAGPSRNLGISFSKGEYIAFIDSDDIWEKNKLKTQINFMKNNNINFSHTSYKIINSQSKTVGYVKAKEKIQYKDLIKSCDIGLSTVICKKKIIKRKKFANLKTKEDFVLWLNIARNNIPIIGLDKKLTQWRDIKDSLSKNTIQKINDAYLVYRKYEKYNIFYSTFCVIRLSIHFFLKKYLIIKNYYINY